MVHPRNNKRERQIHYSGSSITAELKIDQSVAHNESAPTVVALKDTSYTVTAIDETIKKQT
jgi:riboflavin synthase